VCWSFSHALCFSLMLKFSVACRSLWCENAMSPHLIQAGKQVWCSSFSWYAITTNHVLIAFLGIKGIWFTNFFKNVSLLFQLWIVWWTLWRKLWQTRRSQMLWSKR
jgi:hypothetical protein